MKHCLSGLLFQSRDRSVKTSANFIKKTTRGRIGISQGVLHVEQPKRVNLKPEAARMIINICVEAILRAHSMRERDQAVVQVTENSVNQMGA